jgi:hypothetical protein
LPDMKIKAAVLNKMGVAPPYVPCRANNAATRLTIPRSSNLTLQFVLRCIWQGYNFRLDIGGLEGPSTPDASPC